MTRLITSLALLALSSGLVSATTTCSADSQCPEGAPCCSQYGECGTGAYCLGGCDPLFSYSLESCVPAPACQNRSMTFTNMDRLADETKYMGNSSAVDFVYSGSPLIYDDTVLLTMTEADGGTLLSSSTYVWYGKVSANLSSSGGQGVVTAFILLSDVKDEIDWEFVGYNLTQGQTNFYWQAVENYTNGENSTISSNTMTNYHVYEFDWQPDTLTWSIDGTVVRTLNKADTWNATGNKYMYPQTPSRVELSLWPAGAQDNAIGTVDWAGGYVNWNDSTYMTNGYYYASFAEVTIDCYSPPSGANVTGDVSYVYSGTSGLNDTIAVTNETTIISSFLDTGTNKSAGGSSASTASSAPTQGESGTGSNGNRGSGSSSSSSSSATGFSQGSGSGSSSSAASPLLVANEHLLSGSLFAVLLVVSGLLVL